VLTRQTLERVEEPGYAPEHRVPQTDAKGQIVKKPKKPKKPKGNAPVVSEDVRFRR
jgi:ATP-dependent RNA helicase RhlE